LYGTGSGHANLLSASQQCTDDLLLDTTTDHVYHTDCYRLYVLKAGSVKEVAQDDDGGQSGDGHQEKKCEWVVCCAKKYKKMITALSSATNHAKVTADCTKSAKLVELAIFCLQLGTLKMIHTLE
jgi:hypothetical protein